MKKIFFILIATLLVTTVYAQRPFTYEVVQSGGSYYACFYKTREYADREVIIQYRIHFYSDRSSQNRMATILASGSQDRSNGYSENFRIEITDYSVSGGGTANTTQPSSPSSPSQPTSSFPSRPSVSASGVVWAEKNAGADSPEDFGGNYSFMQRVCGGGWRLPTNPELRSLAASPSEWTTLNGVNGRLFHTGSQEVFLPAAGYNGAVDQGKTGYYRSDTSSDNNDSWGLIFGKSKKPRVKAGFSRSVGYSVRCVRD